MKFLDRRSITAQVGALFSSLGHDTLHTLGLPEKNRTPDEALRRHASDDQRVLVTKDADFVDSFLLRGLPPKLLFVTTGNIPNDDLVELFSTNLPAIVNALTSWFFVEIDRSGLTIHEP